MYFKEKSYFKYIKYQTKNKVEHGIFIKSMVQLLSCASYNTRYMRGKLNFTNKGQYSGSRISVFFIMFSTPYTYRIKYKTYP